MRAILCALAVAAAPAVASATDYQEMAALVDVSAFDGADSEWSRRMTQQRTECGYFGRDREARRADVLVSRYHTLADAVEAGDEAAAMDAAKTLYKAIDQNQRFTACWRHIARREGLPGRLTRMLRGV